MDHLFLVLGQRCLFVYQGSSFEAMASAPRYLENHACFDCSDLYSLYVLRPLMLSEKGLESTVRLWSFSRRDDMEVALF